MARSKRKDPEKPIPDPAADGNNTPAGDAAEVTAPKAASFNWHESVAPRPPVKKRRGGRSGRATINDVATRAGVDKSAVSLALRGDERISVATRERIMQVAREMGYVPNSFARSLSGGRSRVIGVMLTDLSNRYFAGPLEEFQAMAEPKGYTLSVKFSSWDVERERRGIYQFCEGWVEGIIWAPSDAHSEEFSEMLQRIAVAKIPVVSLGHIDSTNSVGVDVKTSITLGLEYLKQLGHREIGIASATRVGGWRASQQEYRVSHIRRMAATLGLSFAEENFFDSSNNSYGGVEIAARLMRRDRNTWPTAIYTADDMIGQALVAGLTALGAKVPDEVSILGMDNAPGDLDAQFPLTTVSLEASETGRRAIQLLLDIIDGVVPVEPLQNLTLDPKVVIRKTCGPPRAVVIK